jgi:Tol biopolymer transport system component
MVLGNVDAARAPLEVYLAISPGARKLAYAHPNVAGGIWRIPVPAGKGTKPERLISSTRSDWYPQYSPDGARIAFQSNRSGRGEIFVCNADGSSPIQLTSFDSGFSGSPRWSPDGTKIAFDSSNTGNWDVYTVSAQGGKPLALTHDRADDTVPSWSRDGNWIYFASTRTGRNEVWKARASGGGEIQVTANGGFVAFESVDGRHLYYTKETSLSTLWEMETGGRLERQVLESLVGRNIAVSRRGIYFVSDANSGRAIQFFDFGTRGITTIAPTDPLFTHGLAVSPDERFILYSKTDVLGSELMLVENFR